MAVSHVGSGPPNLASIKKKRNFEVRVRFSVLPKKLRYYLLRFKPEDGDSFLHSSLESGKFGFDAHGIRFTLFTNSSHRISTALATVFASSCLEANNLALSSLNSWLSSLSYHHNIPLQYETVSVIDPLTTVERIFFTTSYNVKSLGNEELGVSQFLSPLYALYREAISNHSFPYRFFCFSKIMEGSFGSINGILSKHAAELGIKIERRRVRVPDSIYIHSQYRSYIGKPVREFYEKEVQKTRKRDLFAHFSLDIKSRQDFDNPSYHHDMANLAFVCDLCARELIQEVYEASLILADAGSRF